MEDAVISWEELRILFGAKMKKYEEGSPVVIRRNTLLTFSRAGTDLSQANVSVDVSKFVAADKAETTKGKSNNPTKNTNGHFIDMTTGARGTFNVSEEGAITFKKTGEDITAEPTAYTLTYPANESEYQVRLFWEDTTSEEAQAANVLVITPDDFPGTFKVIGDALIRSESTGKDEAFQFVINKAKLLSEITLTMQAEGDPSTFSATLNVLRDSKGEMFSLIKY